MARSLSVLAAQAILNLEGARLRLDGIYGTQTVAAVKRASPAVREVLGALSKRFPFEEQEHPVTDPSLELLISKRAEEVNVPPELAIAVARAESQLRPRSVSKTGYVGLFGIGAAAIADVGAAGFHIAAPSGDTLDADWNTQVGVRYIRIVAKRIGADLANRSSWPAIYAAYNLGAANYEKLVRRQFQDSGLRHAVSVQASTLSSGGPEGYLAAVPGFLGIEV